MSGRAKTVFHNTSWSAISQIAFVAAKFISIPLILGLYGKDQYGITVIIAAFGGFLQLLTSGLPAGLVRHASGWLAEGNLDMLRKGARTTLTLYVGVGLLNFAALLAVATAGYHLFNFPEAYIDVIRPMLVAVAVAGLIASYFSVTDQLLAAHEDVAFLSRLNALPSFLELGWILLARQLGLPFHVFFLGQLAAMLCPIPFKLLRLRRRMPLWPYLRPGFYWRECRDLFAFSAGLFSIAVVQNAVNEIRPIVLGMRAVNGAVAAAEFRVLFQITQLIFLMKSWFTDPLLPTVTKAVARGDRAFVERIAFQLTGLAWIITAFPVVMLAVCAREILDVYIGEHRGSMHIWLAVWMLGFIGSYLGPVYSILLARGLFKPLAVFTALAAAVTVVIYWMLAPVWDVGGTVIGNVFYSVAHIVFYHAYLLRRLELDAGRLFREAFLPPLGAALAAGACAWLALQWVAPWPALARLAVGGASGAAVFAGLIAAFVVRPSEFRRVIATLRGRGEPSAPATST